MIPDRDIWRAANLLIRQHGADAGVVAARRADEMLAALMGGRLDLRSKLERDDHEGKIVWLRIRRAIDELQAAPLGKPS